MPNEMPPMSPEISGEMPPIDNGMTPDEMKADLADMLSKVETKKKDLDAQKFINKQNITLAKRKVLGVLFDLLKQSGVDPNDLESINKFMTKLEDQDPDLAILFEDVFNSASPDGAPPKTITPEPNLMDKFKNLGSDMMMPTQPDGVTQGPPTNDPNWPSTSGQPQGGLEFQPANGILEPNQPPL